MQRGAVNILVAILLFSMVFAPSVFGSILSTDATIRGFELDKPSYWAGETIELTMGVLNSDTNVVADGTLVIDLVAEDGTIVSEQLIHDINIEPGLSLPFEMRYAIPSFVPSGDYHLNVYLKNGRTNAMGIPTIFSAPYQIDVPIQNTVEGRLVGVDPEITTIEGETKQAGPFIDKDAASGMLVVKNRGSSAEKGLTATLTAVEWDDTEEGHAESSVTVPLPTIEAQSSVQVPYTLPLPAKAGAYAVLVEIKDGEEVLSVYRLRVVKNGVSARIQQLLIDHTTLEPGREQTMQIVVIGPADIARLGDNYGDDAIPRSTLDGSAVFMIESQGKPVFEVRKELHLDIEEPVFEITYPVLVNTYAQDFTVSAKVYHQNQLLDEYSYVVNTNAFGKSPSLVDFSLCDDLLCLEEATQVRPKHDVYLKLSLREAGEPSSCQGFVQISGNEVNVRPFTGELKDGDYVEVQFPKQGSYVVTAQCEFSDNPGERIVNVGYAGIEIGDGRLGINDKLIKSIIIFIILVLFVAIYYGVYSRTRRQ